MKTRQTEVYGVARVDPGGEETLYHACLRPHGSPVFLGTDGPNEAEYGPAGTIDGFAIAGTFAAAHVFSGEAVSVMCAKYSELPDCSVLERASITVVNVRTRRHVDVPVPFVHGPPNGSSGLIAPGISPLAEDVPMAISPGGGLAWLVPSCPDRPYTYDCNPGGEEELWATMLTPQGRSGFSTSPTMIDSGSIAPGSLRFINANTLTWTNGGVSRHQTIG